MNDSILLSKISGAVRQVCTANNIKKVNKLAVVVNYRSHVDKDNLYEHLQYTSKDLVGLWTDIKVELEDIHEQMVILHSIEGDQG